MSGYIDMAFKMVGKLTLIYANKISSSFVGLCCIQYYLLCGEGSSSIGEDGESVEDIESGHAPHTNHHATQHAALGWTQHAPAQYR
jgi:hypothetical protein